MSEVMGRADFFAEKRFLPRVEVVEVPDWERTACVRMLSGKERDAWEAGLHRIAGDGSVSPNLTNVRGRLLALTLCDDEGRRLFTDDDAGQLGDLPAAPLEVIFEAASKLNALGGRSRERAEKNSEAPPG